MGVFVITGANSGLGFETARILASDSLDSTVILACRDAGRASVARDVIVEATGNTHVIPTQLDVASLASVRAFAAQIEGPIDALICNAGISRGPAQTVDGLDAVFETNHLGHFLLTQLLQDRMSSTGRILVVSSDMHQPPGPALKWPGADALAHGAGGGMRYSYSKLSNLYFVYELSRRLHGSDISVAAFNPGLMTETSFASVPAPIGAVMKRIFASRVGSLDTSSAALAKLASGTRTIDGLYFDRTASAPSPSSKLSYDEENARDLWAVSERLTRTGD